VLREGGTLELDRLRRNLLSSMPLCFNLFGKLRAEPQTAARVLGRVLGLDIATIDEVLVEYAPAAGKAALKDRTAFDAFVAYRTSSGSKGFLGVETKYTEPFSPTIYPANRYEPLDAYQTARFRPGAAQRLARPATNQLWRNVLLAAATRADGGFRIGHAVVIAGQDDQAARRAVSALKAELDDPDGLLRSVSLERLVEECLGEPLLAGWAAEFRRRYLDLSPIAECFPLRTVATRRSRAPLQAADSEKVRQLAAHCRTVLGELTNLVDPPGYPDSLAMCLLDAIWSMGVRYTAVVRVVNRYRQHRNGLGADSGRDGLADLLTTIDLAGSPAAFADLVGNRQRTATQNGVLKADAVQVAARLLAGQGIDTTGDLHAAIRAGHARQLEGIWRTVPGQRSGISWRYLLMLAGVAEVKPDRMIRRFVATALGVADVDPQTAASLLVQLQRGSPGVSLRALDHAIWQYQRNQARGQRSA
jgi:hypothetical protein